MRNVLQLQRDTQNFEACLYFTSASINELSNNFLHTQELSIYNNIKFEKRKHSYLLGRYCAKQAINGLFCDRISNKDIDIKAGVFENPLINEPSNLKLGISISHSKSFGAAIAYPESHPMAVDLEVINKNNNKTIESQMTKKDLSFISSLSLEQTEGLALLWTFKEALSKALKCGLTTSFKILEINNMWIKDGYYYCDFKNFSQYQAFGFIGNEYALSCVLPKKTEITNISDIVGDMSKCVCF